MAALTSHYSLGVMAKNRRMITNSPMKLWVSDSAIRFLRTSTRSVSAFGAISLDSTPPLRSLTPSLSEVAEGDDVSEIQIAGQLKTVHVKFVLQKECKFGEQFLLVGDDPMFGLWDLANAIPLDWSEGHFWSAEMDFPIGRSVQFKFIHRARSGEVHWQPGPDRVLQIWETTNTIIVTEDWENADNQKITEGQLTDMVDKVIVSENMVSGDPSIEEVIPMVNAQGIVEVISSENKADNNQNAESIAAELNVGNNMASNEEDAVLVPGLPPIPVSRPNKAAEGKPLVAADRAEECSSPPQLSGEEGQPEISNEILLAEETIALRNKQIDDSEDKVITGVLSNDMQWGRKALQRFLLNLGFRREEKSNT